MNKNTQILYKLNDKIVAEEKGFSIWAFIGVIIEDQNGNFYKICEVETKVNENIITCFIKPTQKKIINVNKISKKPDVKVIDKVIIKSRERIGKKWQGWKFDTYCSSLEEAKELVEELNKESFLKEFKIMEKKKKEIKTNELNVVNAPYIIQCKERDTKTGKLSSWKLYKRFKTEKERNEAFEEIMNEVSNENNYAIYRIKNVKITRQHLNKLNPNL